MSIPVIQAVSLILPQFWVTGQETEAVNDLLTHVSREFYIADLHEKKVHITAIENIQAAGVPGNLWCWVELSPVSSVISAAYWAAIGGGGGFLAPVVPTVIVATGVNATTHSIMLPWAIHSAWARAVVQTPVAATPATDFWNVQVMVSGKT